MSDHATLHERIREAPGTWLVTGAAGFIGSNLVESLLELDQRVIGLDNFASGKRENLAAAERAVGRTRWGNFRLIEGDIRSPGDCREACRSVRYVLHQAALGSVPQSIDDPLAYHATNVTGFLNMRLAARDAGVARFVYAGSSATYGDHPALPQQEPHIGRPLSPYGLSKYVDELYADLFARCYGSSAIGLRYFNVFGPRQDPQGAYAAVIPQWVARMIRGEPVHINGDGETARDFCYVANVVQANLLAATVEDPAALDQVYNIALGNKTTLNQLYATLRELLAPRFPHLRGGRPEYRDFRPGDVALSQADIGKAMRLLGYRPQWRLREGLAQAIDWYAGAMPRRERSTTAARSRLESYG
jgi:UDP-N-acetylglucosamine/UDP-N-acetyl-alpha-D-glucosaminouronate 4-epimerase